MKEIQEFEENFQRKYFPKWANIEYDQKLLYLATALAGEIGELANVIKKRHRKILYNLKADNKKEKEYTENIIEELVDIFAYTLIFSNVLNIDLKREYFKKMEKNKKKYGSSK